MGTVLKTTFAAGNPTAKVPAEWFNIVAKRLNNITIVDGTVDIGDEGVNIYPGVGALAAPTVPYRYNRSGALTFRMTGPSFAFKGQPKSVTDYPAADYDITVTTGQTLYCFLEIDLLGTADPKWKTNTTGYPSGTDYIENWSIVKVTAAGSGAAARISAVEQIWNGGHISYWP